MSIEENKANARRLAEEVVNKGGISIVDELIASNYVFHYPGYDYKGPEGFREYLTMMKIAFPDYNATIDSMFAEGDMVVAFVTVRGTFKGEMMGIAPTGKKFTVPAAVLSRFEGGKQVEAWSYANMLAMYQQLGISPPAG